ncbi:MAG: radical SAM protein, partial [Candidatus Omnitrophota bacterium]
WAVETQYKIEGSKNKDLKLLIKIGLDGDFNMAVANDIYGNERANIGLALPENIFLVTMFDSSAVVGDSLADRIIYRADTTGHIYELKDKLSETFFLQEFKYSNGAGFVDSLIAGLPLSPSLYSLAGQKLQEGLQNIIKTLTLNGDVYILKALSQKVNGGITVVYRIENDSRILLFIATKETPNIVINTDWNGDNALEGYEFSSLGVVFKNLGSKRELTAASLLNTLSKKEVRKLGQYGIDIERDLPLSESRSYLLAGNDFNKPVWVSSRYIMNTDAFNSRDLARLEKGQLRFIDWDTTGKAPFGVSNGEASIVPGIGLIKSTEFAEHDTVNKEYIYDVKYEYRNARKYKHPKARIGFNYDNGLVWEFYTAEEWKLYAKDGIYLLLNRVKEDGEYLNSRFVTIVDVDSLSGHCDILTVEELITKTPAFGPLVTMVRNGKLYAIKEGTGIAYRIQIDPYNDPIGERIYNSFPGRSVRYLTGMEDVNDEINKAQYKGERQKITSSVNTSLPVFVDWEKRILSLDFWIFSKLPSFFRYVIAFIFGSILFAAFMQLTTWIRERGSEKKNINFIDYLRARKLFKDEAMVRKLIYLQELSGPLAIGRNIPPKQNREEREEFLNHYLLGYGFNEAEATILARLHRRGKITIEDQYVAPRVSSLPISAIQIKEAAAKGYSKKAIVIQGLLDSGLIREDDLSDAEKAVIHEKHAWEEIMKYLVGLSEKRVAEQIKGGDFSKVHKLLPTPSAKTLQLMLEEDILPKSKIVEIARRKETNSTLYELILAVLMEEIILPIFEFVFFRTHKEVISNSKVVEDIFEKVSGELTAAIFSNPRMLLQMKGRPLNEKDMVYVAFPLNRAIEPVTLKELIILNFITTDLTNTRNHSFGEFSGVWPLMLYVTRKVKEMVDVPGMAHEVIRERTMNFVADCVTVFGSVLRHQVRILKNITASKQTWITPENRTQHKGIMQVDLFDDLDMPDLFEKLYLKGSDIDYELSSPSSPAAGGIHEWAERIRSTAGDNDPIASAHKAANGKPEFAGLNDTLTDLADRLKAMTLELGREFAPEATHMDEQTRKGTGIIHLYDRILYILFSPKTWGLSGARMVAAVLFNLAAVVALGIYLAAGHLAIGTGLIFSSTLLAPILFGKATNLKEKLFWASIVLASSWYVFGLMVHHLFWKAELIDLTDLLLSVATLLGTALLSRIIANLGMSVRAKLLALAIVIFAPLVALGYFANLGLHFTIILLLLTVIPTIISAYHLRVTPRSDMELYKELWSKTARSIVGLRSFIRVFGIYWPGFYKKWHKELSSCMPLLPDGRDVTEHLADLIEEMYYYSSEFPQGLLSREERDSWVAGLHGEDRGRFVKPRSVIARQILYDTFFTLSQKKPLTEVLSALKPITTHVQAWRELYTHTFENTALFGTFDNNSSLLGYIAKRYPEWTNLMEGLVGRFGNIPVLEQLRNITERSDIPEILFSPLVSNEQRQLIINSIIAWLNEVRPSDAATVRSEAKDFVTYHLYLSSQPEMLDYTYHQAVREVARRYASLHKAFMELSPQQNLGALEKHFVDNYSRYQHAADLKLRQIFHDVALWDENVLINRDGSVKIVPLEIIIQTLERIIADGLARPEIIAAVQSVLDSEAVRDYRNEKIVPPGHNSIPLDTWARNLLRWRNEHLQEVVTLLNGCPELRNGWNLLTGQIAPMVIDCVESNVRLVFSDTYEETMFYDKNAYIAGDLWLGYGRQVNCDALTRALPGQEVWKLTIASILGRNPHIAIINPMIEIWGADYKAFFVPRLYKISQKVWAGDVQRARRRMLTFYGKGSGRQQALCYIYSRPGEDFEGFVIMQGSQPLFESTQTDFYVFNWRSAVLFAESICGTETRYPFNVTLAIQDRPSFATFFNEKLGFDKKLSHLALWFHYFIVPFALALQIILPYLAPFSAFASLRPFFYFIFATYLLLEAINSNNFVRHKRETGSFVIALGLTIYELFIATPLYLFLLPMFLKGIWLASNGFYAFLDTVKTAFLQVWDYRQRYENTMLFKLFSEKGWHLNAAIALSGIVAWLSSFFLSTPIGPALLIFYLLSSAAMYSGPEVFGAFLNRKGELKGANYWRWFRTVLVVPLLKDLIKKEDRRASSPLSRGLNSRDSRKIRQVIDLAFQQNRIHEPDEKMRHILAESVDYFRQQEDYASAELISDTDYLFLMPDSDIRVNSPPYYIWYASERKFLLVTTIQREGETSALLPYELLNYLFSHNAHISLIAQMLLHQAKHVFNAFTSINEGETEEDTIIFAVRSAMLSVLVSRYARTLDANLKEELLAIYQRLGRVDASELLDAFPMLKTMNIDIPAAIENGGIEVSVAMTILEKVGETIRAEIERDYRRKPSVMFRDGRFKGVYILPQEKDLGSGSGIYHLLEVYLNPKDGLAKESRHESAKKEKKLIIHILSLNAGVGSRDVLLTIVSGNIKGEVYVYGRTLSEQNIEQVKGLVAGLLKKGIYGEWFFVAPADNIVLPTDHIAETYNPAYGFYLYALKWRVLRNTLANLKRYGPAFGQMARTTDYKVKAFREKEPLLGTLQNVIRNAIEEAAYPNVETYLTALASALGYAGLEEFKRFFHNDPLTYFVLPKLVGRETWGELYSQRGAQNRLTSEKWDEYYEQANKAYSGTAKELIENLLVDNRPYSFSNSFYFLFNRPVAETIYSEYLPLWNWGLPQDMRDKEPFDWSTHLIAPMVMVKRPELWRAFWKEKKHKSCGLYTEGQWMDLLTKAEKVLKVAGADLLCVDVPLWNDVGNPLETKVIVDLGVSNHDPLLRALYLGLFGHPIPDNGSNISPDAVLRGNFDFTGSIRVNSNSTIINKGRGRVIFGRDITIENSYLEIDTTRGDVYIPDCTLFSESDILGEFRGEGEGDYFYRLYANQGITFIGGELHSSVLSRDGKFSVHHPIEFDIKKVIKYPDGTEHKVVDDIIPGSRWTYGQHLDGDSEGPILNFGWIRGRARDLWGKLEYWRIEDDRQLKNARITARPTRALGLAELLHKRVNRTKALPELLQEADITMYEQAQDRHTEKLLSSLSYDERLRFTGFLLRLEAAQPPAALEEVRGVYISDKVSLIDLLDCLRAHSYSKVNVRIIDRQTIDFVSPQEAQVAPAAFAQAVSVIPEGRLPVSHTTITEQIKFLLKKLYPYSLVPDAFVEEIMSLHPTHGASKQLPRENRLVRFVEQIVLLDALHSQVFEGLHTVLVHNPYLAQTALASLLDFTEIAVITESDENTQKRFIVEELSGVIDEEAAWQRRISDTITMYVFEVRNAEGKGLDTQAVLKAYQLRADTLAFGVRRDTQGKIHLAMASSPVKATIVQEEIDRIYHLFEACAAPNTKTVQRFLFQLLEEPRSLRLGEYSVEERVLLLASLLMRALENGEVNLMLKSLVSIRKIDRSIKWYTQITGLMREAAKQMQPNDLMCLDKIMTIFGALEKFVEVGGKKANRDILEEELCELFVPTLKNILKPKPASQKEQENKPHFVLVGILGRKRTGKSLLGGYLKSQYGFKLYDFFSKPKQIAMYAWRLTYEEMYSSKTAESREILNNLFDLIASIDPEAYIDYALSYIVEYVPSASEAVTFTNRWVVADLRLEKEVDAIRRTGGQVWKINRKEEERLIAERVVGVTEHITETAVDMVPPHKIDLIIENDGSIEDFLARIRQVVRSMGFDRITFGVGRKFSEEFDSFDEYWDFLVSLKEEMLKRSREYSRNIRGQLEDLALQFISRDRMLDRTPAALLRKAKKAQHALELIYKTKETREEFIRFVLANQTQDTFKNRVTPLFIVVANWLLGRPIWDRSVLKEHRHLFARNFTVRQHAWFGRGIVANIPLELPRGSLKEPTYGKIRILLSGSAEKLYRNFSAALYLRKILHTVLPEKMEIEIYADDINFPQWIHNFDHNGNYMGRKRTKIDLDENGVYLDTDSGIRLIKVELGDLRRDLLSLDFIPQDRYDIVISSRLAIQYCDNAELLMVLRNNLVQCVKDGGLLLFDTEEANFAEVIQIRGNEEIASDTIIPYQDVDSQRKAINRIDASFPGKEVDQNLHISTAYKLAQKFATRQNTVLPKVTIARLLGSFGEPLAAGISVMLSGVPSYAIEAAFGDTILEELESILPHVTGVLDMTGYSKESKIILNALYRSSPFPAAPISRLTEIENLYISGWFRIVYAKDENGNPYVVCYKTVADKKESQVFAIEGYFGDKGLSLQKAAHAESLVGRNRVKHKGGTIATILLKGGFRGGLSPWLKDAMVQFFTEIGYRVTEGIISKLSADEVLRRWGVTNIMQSFNAMRRNPNFGRNFMRMGEELIRNCQGHAFLWWLSQAEIEDPRDMSRRALAYTMFYLAEEAQQIMLRRVRSRSAILDSAGLTRAGFGKLMKERGFKGDVEELDEQDFVKVLVGAMNPFVAHRFTVRGRLVAKELRGKGRLLWIIEEAQKTFGLTNVDDVVSIANAIHAPSKSELGNEFKMMESRDLDLFLVDEITNYRIEDIGDPQTEGISLHLDSVLWGGEAAVDKAAMLDILIDLRTVASQEVVNPLLRGLGGASSLVFSDETLKRILNVFPELALLSVTKFKHTIRLAEFLAKLAGRDFEYFWEELKDKYKKGVSKKFFLHKMQELGDMYLSLSEVEREDLLLAALLHDVGTIKGMALHPEYSKVYVRVILKNLGYADNRVEWVSNLVGDHVIIGKVVYSGEATYAYTLSSLGCIPAEKLQAYLYSIIILTCLDAAGYNYQGGSDLPLVYLEAFLRHRDVGYIKSKSEDTEQWKYRLGQLIKSDSDLPATEKEISSLTIAVERFIPSDEYPFFVRQMGYAISDLCEISPILISMAKFNDGLKTFLAFNMFISRIAALALQTEKAELITRVSADEDLWLTPKPLIGVLARKIQSMLLKHMLTLNQFEAYLERNGWSEFMGIPIRLVKGQLIIGISQIMLLEKTVAKEVCKGKGMILLGGTSGSGKTAVANISLSSVIRAFNRKDVVVSLDRYYRDDAMLNRLPGTNDPDFETPEALDSIRIKHDLGSILAGEATELPDFDMRRGISRFNSGEIKTRGAGDILICESLYSLHQEVVGAACLSDAQTLKIFLTAPPFIRILRRLIRDVNEGRLTPYENLKYWKVIKDREKQYVEPTIASADYVFANFSPKEIFDLLPVAMPLLEEAYLEAVEKEDNAVILAIHNLLQDINNEIGPEYLEEYGFAWQLPASSPLSRGLNSRDSRKIRQVIDLAFQQNRIHEPDEKMRHILAESVDYFRQQEDYASAELISDTDYLFLMPDSDIRVNSPPYYIWYASERKFLLVTTIQREGETSALLPYELLNYLFSHNAHISLIAQMLLHQAKHVFNAFTSINEGETEEDTIIFAVRSAMLSVLVSRYARTLDANLKEELLAIYQRLGRVDASELLDAFPMLKTMNIDIPAAIENGGIEVSVAMTILEKVGETIRAEIERDYRRKPSVMFRDGRFKGVYILPQEKDLGSGSGIYHLLEVYLNPKDGLAKESRHESAKKEKKLIIHILSLNAGVGSRDVLLTIVSGNIKGEVYVYGRTLSEQNIEQVKGLVAGLLKKGIYGEWFFVAPADNIVLPTDHIAETYNPAYGFYLYALKWRVLRNTLANLKRYGPAFGQMARTTDYKVKAFREKEPLLGTLQNVIRNAIEEAAYPNVETYLTALASALGYAGLEEFKRFFHNDPLTYFVLPKLVGRETWGELYSQRGAQNRLTSEKWDEYYEQANKAYSGTAKELIENLLVDNRPYSFSNSFYFLFNRPVAETIYSEYLPLWNWGLPQDMRDKEPFDWSTHLIAPMVMVKRPELWRAFWKEKKHKSCGLYTEGQWMDLLTKAEKVLKVAGADLLCVDVPLWNDVGNPLETKVIVDLGVSNHDPLLRALYLGLFGHPIPDNGSNISPDAVLRGNFDFTGSIRVNSNSTIINKGRGRVIFGRDITIENSYLEIDTTRGDVYIPDCTLFSESDILGEFRGEGEGDYFYRLYANQGITFIGGELHSSVLSRDGKFSVHHPIEFDIKKVIKYPDGTEHKVVDDIIPGSRWTYGQHLDGDSEGPILNFGWIRGRARDLWGKLEYWRIEDDRQLKNARITARPTRALGLAELLHKRVNRTKALPELLQEADITMYEQAQDRHTEKLLSSLSYDERLRFTGFLLRLEAAQPPAALEEVRGVYISDKVSLIDLLDCLRAHSYSKVNVRIIDRQTIDFVSPQEAQVAPAAFAQAVSVIPEGRLPVSHTTITEQIKFLLKKLYPYSLVPDAFVEEIMSLHPTHGASKQLPRENRLVRFVEQIVLLDALHSQVFEGLHTVLVHNPYLAQTALASLLDFTEIAVITESDENTQKRFIVEELSGVIDEEAAWQRRISDTITMYVFEVRNAEGKGLDTQAVLKAYQLRADTLAFGVRRDTQGKIHLAMASSPGLLQPHQIIPKFSAGVKMLPLENTLLLYNNARIDKIKSRILLINNPIVALPEVPAAMMKLADGKRSLQDIYAALIQQYPTVTLDFVLFVFGQLFDRGYFALSSENILPPVKDTYSSEDWDLNVGRLQQLMPVTTLPLYVLLELTRKCTRTCVTCYLKYILLEAAQGELEDLEDTAYLTEVVQAVIDSGVAYVTILGGEPLLRKSLIYAIVEKMRAANIYVKIITNGDLLTKQVAQQLDVLDLNKVELSIDGLDSETNDSIRGHGSFKKIQRALKALSNTSIPEIGISITLSSFNFERVLGDLSSFLLSNPHITKVYFSRFFKHSRCSYAAEELTIEQIGLLQEAIVRWTQEFLPQRPRFEAVVLDLGKCSCGRSMVVISNSGRIKPCPFSNALGPRVSAESGLRRIWTEAFTDLRALPSTVCFSRLLRDGKVPASSSPVKAVSAALDLIPLNSYSPTQILGDREFAVNDRVYSIDDESQKIIQEIRELVTLAINGNGTSITIRGPTTYCGAVTSFLNSAVLYEIFRRASRMLSFGNPVYQLPKDVNLTVVVADELDRLAAGSGRIMVIHGPLLQKLAGSEFGRELLIVTMAAKLAQVLGAEAKDNERLVLMAAAYAVLAFEDCAKLQQYQEFIRPLVRDAEPQNGYLAELGAISFKTVSLGLGKNLLEKEMVFFNKVWMPSNNGDASSFASNGLLWALYGARGEYRKGHSSRTSEPLITDRDVVFNLGCGAGTLALTALHLGAREIFASDKSLRACVTAALNFARLLTSPRAFETLHTIHAEGLSAAKKLIGEITVIVMNAPDPKESAVHDNGSQMTVASMERILVDARDFLLRGVRVLFRITTEDEGEPTLWPGLFRNAGL